MKMVSFGGEYDVVRVGYVSGKSRWRGEERSVIRYYESGPFGGSMSVDRELTAQRDFRWRWAAVLWCFFKSLGAPDREVSTYSRKTLDFSSWR